MFKNWSYHNKGRNQDKNIWLDVIHIMISIHFKTGLVSLKTAVILSNMIGKHVFMYKYNLQDCILWLKKNYAIYSGCMYL